MPIALLPLLALLAVFAAPGPLIAGPQAAGGVETVWIGDPPVALPARLDTTLEISTLGAADLVLFDRAGSEWARFTVGVAGGRESVLEGPVLRMAREGEPPGPVTERPVVRLLLCLAGKRAAAEFVLADRSGRDYPLRVGRAFLGADIRVDPARTFLASHLCVRP